MDRNINMDDVHFAINNSLKNEVECVFSDLNSDNLVFRIRLLNSKSLMASKKIHLTKQMKFTCSKIYKKIFLIILF